MKKRANFYNKDVDNAIFFEKTILSFSKQLQPPKPGKMFHESRERFPAVLSSYRSALGHYIPYCSPFINEEAIITAISYVRLYRKSACEAMCKILADNTTRTVESVFTLL